MKQLAVQRQFRLALRPSLACLKGQLDTNHSSIRSPYPNPLPSREESTIASWRTVSRPRPSLAAALSASLQRPSDTGPPKVYREVH